MEESADGMVAMRRTKKIDISVNIAMPRATLAVTVLAFASCHRWLLIRCAVTVREHIFFVLREERKNCVSVRKDSVSKFYGEIFRAQGGSIGADDIMFVSGGIGYRVEYVFPDGGGAYHHVQVGDPKKLDMNLSAKRKTAYPEANLHCVPPVAAQKLNELARFLAEQNGEPDSK
jgi:hypothetical protein